MAMFWKKKQNQEPKEPLEPKGGFFTTDDFRTPRIKDALNFVKNAVPIAPPMPIMPTGMDKTMSDTKIITSGRQTLPDANLNWYASQTFIGYQLCSIMAQNWLVRKACHKPARDAAENWFDITFDDGEDVDPKVIDYMNKIDRRMKLKQSCVEFVEKGREFGVRHALFVVESDDPEYYEKPFNPDGIKAGTYRGISQIDPYWIFPELSGSAATDPSAINFYEPTYYLVGDKRIHKSHFAIMRNGQVADLLKPTYLYGGVPLPQMIFERVYAAERTANEAPLLAMTKRTTALHADMDKAMADQETFESKLAQWIYYRDNFGIKALGLEEQIEQFDTALSDFAETIMSQYQLCASIAGMPATELLEMSPGGFNATGEFEQKSYNKTLKSIQEVDMTDLVEQHHICVMRSLVAPKFGIKPLDTEIEWNPVDAPTAREEAEIRKMDADTAAVYANAGAIDGIDIRQKIIADKESGWNGLEDRVEGQEEFLSGENDETSDD